MADNASSPVAKAGYSRRAFIGGTIVGAGTICRLLQNSTLVGAAEDATVPAAPTHPLDPLSETELVEAVKILRSTGQLEGSRRVVLASLDEPEKQMVREYTAGQPFPRNVFVLLLDRVSGLGYEAIIDLVAKKVVWCHALPAGLHPPYIEEEFIDCEAVVKASAEFQAALAKRGVTDLELLMLDGWPAGNYGDEPADGKVRRLLRFMCFVRAEAEDNGYARPIDNLIAVVDSCSKEVVRIEDYGVVPLPKEPGNYARKYIADTREGLKSVQTVQPAGPSFTVEGHEVRWQNWRFRVGFNHREGLVLHTVSYSDQGRERQVVYRASIAELVVAYGDPGEAYFRKNPFDIGEVGIGVLANSLLLDCDCLGTIHYFDVPLVMNNGETNVLKNAVCLHEEDAGILWKHTDFRLKQTEVRRARKLVVSFIATVGNYDYGFYWSFHQDGTLQCEVKLTGIMNTTALRPGESSRWGGEVAPQLNAPFHQHSFVARLDMDVDGTANSVYEVNAMGLAEGKENPKGNAIRVEASLLATEKQAQRLTNSGSARFWRIVNTERTNRLGHPVSYRLVPGENSPPFAQSNAVVRHRAGFTSNALWVTPYRTDERYPAGEYVNQHPGGDGLPRWTAADRSVANTDVVVWYVFSHAHVPRLEDWPVMPVSNIGFMLKPDGFFERNPAIDLPPP